VSYDYNENCFSSRIRPKTHLNFSCPVKKATSLQPHTPQIYKTSRPVGLEHRVASTIIAGHHIIRISVFLLQSTDNFEKTQQVRVMSTNEESNLARIHRHSLVDRTSASIDQKRVESISSDGVMASDWNSSHLGILGVLQQPSFGTASSMKDRLSSFISEFMLLWASWEAYRLHRQQLKIL